MIYSGTCCLLQRDKRKESVLQWKWHLSIGSGALTSASTFTQKCIENFEVLHTKMRCRDTGVMVFVVVYNSKHAAILTSTTAMLSNSCDC